MGTQAPNESFLFVHPERGTLWKLFLYATFCDIDAGRLFLESNDEGLMLIEAVDRRKLIVFTIAIRKILSLLNKPMNWTGRIIEFNLNLLSNIAHGTMEIPTRGSDTFISAIGFCDSRIDLLNKKNSLVAISTEMPNRAIVDLCIMSAKLVYENDRVVKKVVNNRWNMHFVDYYYCLNDYQNEYDTGVFIMCDKPTDANLIVISFRGTKPFDADNWSTDFDYPWYQCAEGKVHIGFLEAMGLGDRSKEFSFQTHLSSNVETKTDPLMEMIPYMGKKSAYFAVKSKLESLLKDNKNAKFVVTGHSLGGALAILFPTVMELRKEPQLLNRLLGVYTFGQPRIGDDKLGNFMEERLNKPNPRYFRIVYSNDLVPRVPYDDKSFLYKHFGECIYFNSLYHGKEMQEEPDKNFFKMGKAIGIYFNAVWELMRSFLMKYLYGRDYEEGWTSIMARVLGISFPGISAHCPTDYVNSVRLGDVRTN
ncbi:hypothetical protein UlMin_012134 [Ulmus minor]